MASFGQLLLYVQDQVAQTVQLTEAVLTIGRTPENGLALSAPSISRNHAEVRNTGQGLVITDLGSANGTFVDGARLLPNQPRLLAHGARIQIGPFLLVYQAAAQAQPEQAQRASDGTAALGADIEPDAGAPQIAPALPLEGAAPITTAGIRAMPTVRPTMAWPRPAPYGPGSRYVRNLPVIYHEEDFLARYLLIFEAIWEPLEQRQDWIDLYFDPRTTPTAFLPWLASWIDLALNPHWPEDRCRRLLAEAAELYRWRGTSYELTRVIELCTGLTPEILEDSAQPFIFRIRMKAPSGEQIDRALVENLVRAHKPAHAGYVLELYNHE